MARDKELHQQFKERVRKYYFSLDELFEFGVKKHTSVWCTHKAAHKYLIKPKTVESYIYS
jgi:hypothetical protein